MRLDYQMLLKSLLPNLTGWIRSCPSLVIGVGG